MPPDQCDEARPSWRVLFRNRDFRHLWVVGLVIFAVRWLETLAIGVFVYAETQSAFLVSMVTMLRVLPMGLFGAVIGAMAERIEKRTALILIMVVSLGTSFVMAALAWADALQVWHLGVASFINGLSWAADNPVRRALIGQVAGASNMGLAMSVDVGTNNASRMLGPTIGGLLLALFGIQGTFLVGVGLYALGVVSAIRIEARNPDAQGPVAPVLARLAEGVAVVRQSRELIGTLAVTIIFNIFGWPITSMVPVIGRDQLLLGPEGIGVLGSLEGIGAFAGAVAVAMWVRPRHYKPCYVGGVALYLLGMLGLAASPHAVPAAVALTLVGFAQAGFSIMQATLVYIAAPAEVRARVLGILTMCIGTGPVGFIHIGLLAEWIGAPWATVIVALEGLVALVLTRRLWMAIRSE